MADGFYIAAIIVGGATFAPEAVRGLLRARLGVGLLMTIAAFGAVLLGEYAEAASLAFLFSISEALEEWAITKSRRALRAVLDLVPAAFGVLGFGAVVAVHEVAEIVVIGNGLRARQNVHTKPVRRAVR